MRRIVKRAVSQVKPFADEAFSWLEQAREAPLAVFDVVVEQAKVLVR